MDADYALFADVVTSGSLSAAACKLALTKAGATFHADVTAFIGFLQDRLDPAPWGR